MEPPDDLEWAVWRLVLAKVATLREIDEHYTYLDLLLANEALDLQEESEYLNQQAEEARRKARRG